MEKKFYIIPQIEEYIIKSDEVCLGTASEGEASEGVESFSKDTDWEDEDWEDEDY